MKFFQEMITMLDHTLATLNQPQPTHEDREYAAQLVNQVFETAEQMGGSILGDVDNQLITKATLIKEKLEN